MGLPCVKGDFDLLAHRFPYKEAIHTILPSESLRSFLKRKYSDENSCPMYPSTYIQLCGYELTGTLPRTIMISSSLPIRRIESMWYITILDKKIKTSFYRLDIPGQWVIQLDDNKFLGLTSFGPCILSFEQWISLLRDDTKEYFENKMGTFSVFFPNRKGG